MPEQIFLLGNIVIMFAYAAITVVVIVPVIRAGQPSTNKLTIAAGLLLFSGAAAHGLYAMTAYRSGLQDSFRAEMQYASWPLALLDLCTVGVGILYWSRQRRPRGPHGGSSADPGRPGQDRLDRADALEQAARDVAENHRANLAVVVEHTDDAIIGVSCDGVTITAWNRGAERLFGYTAEEIIGEPVAILTENTAEECRNDVLNRIGRGERSISYEAQRVHKTGALLEVSLNVTPIKDTAGNLTGISVVARDIASAKAAAERRRLIDEQTQQAQRMESLGNLAGGVAHDFNNILAIIVNYTEFVVEATAGDSAVQADLVQIRNAAERAMKLTRQLLTFTRGDAIQPQDVDLGSAIAEVQAVLERTIGDHIRLTASPTTTPTTVHIDPGQLQQVLLNLALNARDAMPDGGTLVLEANTTVVDGHEHETQPALAAGTYARLLVSDTGDGMTPEVAARVFEPFFTTKPRGQGTGLGLSTVYGIVTEAGGAISLYSEPGVGTTFRLYLPLVAAPTQAPLDATTPTAPAPGRGRTVLVVDDEPALGSVVARILANGGYHVLSAAGGRQALAIQENRDCDLLLTDVIMPEISGRQLVELIHRQRPGLPVLYMSGYSNGLLGATHVLDDDIAFIEKPFTANDLLHKVDDVLASAPAPHHVDLPR